VHDHHDHRHLGLPFGLVAAPAVRAADHGGAALLGARDAEAPRPPPDAGRPRVAGPPQPARGFGHPGTGARDAAGARPVHPASGLRGIGAHGLRLFHRPRGAELLPHAEQRRRGDPVLLRLPLHRRRRPRALELGRRADAARRRIDGCGPARAQGALV
ncbi:MAG: hypothetical protein AVDCRST_MAG08-2884, partial [uncultured Acetobacteraceae bacterium]